MLRGISFCICISVMLSLFAQMKKAILLHLTVLSINVGNYQKSNKKFLDSAISTQHISAPIDITTP